MKFQIRNYGPKLQNSVKPAIVCIILSIGSLSKKGRKRGKDGTKKARKDEGWEHGWTDIHTYRCHNIIIIQLGCVKEVLSDI